MQSGLRSHHATSPSTPTRQAAPSSHTGSLIRSSRLPGWPQGRGSLLPPCGLPVQCPHRGQGEAARKQWLEFLCSHHIPIPLVSRKEGDPRNETTCAQCILRCKMGSLSCWLAKELVSSDPTVRVPHLSK